MKQGAFKFYLIKPVPRLRTKTFWNSNFVTTSAGENFLFTFRPGKVHLEVLLSLKFFLFSLQVHKPFFVPIKVLVSG